MHQAGVKADFFYLLYAKDKIFYYIFPDSQIKYSNSKPNRILQSCKNLVYQKREREIPEKGTTTLAKFSRLHILHYTV